MKVLRLLYRPYLALFVAPTVYLLGIWDGHFLDLRANSEYCTAKPLGSPATSWSWLPLTHKCHWSDGTTTDLVPGYVNPTVIASLVFAAICGVLAIWARHSKANTT